MNADLDRTYDLQMAYTQTGFALERIHNLSHRWDSVEAGRAIANLRDAANAVVSASAALTHEAAE